MKITSHGFAVLDPNKDNQLSRLADQEGKLDYDLGISVYYTPRIAPGMVVIDAGAAIGDHTIAYIKATGNPALVHAFECNPDMVECLRHNCPGVNVYPYALSEKEEILFFHNNFDNAGGAFCDRDPKGGVPIRAMPLDSFNIQNVGFIKWDLEGFETKAIRGAARTIARSCPIMFVEVMEPMVNRAGGTLKELFDLICSLGYRWKTVLGEINNRGEYFELLCEPN